MTRSGAKQSAASPAARCRSPLLHARKPSNTESQFDDLLACEAVGPDATELAGCAKLYLPFIDAPPSQRPFAFVLQLARDTSGGLVWVFIAFGHRHPPAGVRSVYKRAHRELHGRFPPT